MDATPVSFLNWGNSAAAVAALGFLIPLVTALVTKHFASSQLKALVTAFLAVLTGTIGTLVALDGGWDWSGFIDNFLNAFVTAIAAYYGLLKPIGLAGSVAHATRNLGIGSARHYDNDRGLPE